jgi:hypothetical protein
VNDELVDVVDEQDRVVATVTRARIRAEGLLHRVASVLVFRPDGPAAGAPPHRDEGRVPGCVRLLRRRGRRRRRALRTARDRELAEEMGIEGAAAMELFRHRFEGAGDRSWSAVYAISWAGPVVPQASEVAWHGWESIERVLERAAEPTFVPDGREVLRRWVDEGGSLPPGTLGSAG